MLVYSKLMKLGQAIYLYSIESKWATSRLRLTLYEASLPFIGMTRIYTDFYT